LIAATKIKRFLTSVVVSNTFFFVCSGATSGANSLEENYEPSCYAILSDGVLRDLDSVCGREQNPALSSPIGVPESPYFEEAFNVSREAYCEALADGVSPLVALEEAAVTARLYFEVNGMDGNSFQALLASRQRSLGRQSC
jgi:hypothetical protein